MIDFNLFFQRIGGIGGLLSDFNVFAATNIVNDTNYISAFFTGDDLAMIDGFEAQQLSAQNNMNSYPSYWANNAATIINQTVLNDNPLLTSTNTIASLQELIYQMQQNSQTLKQYLSTFTITPTLLQGNGVCVGSVLTPDGLNCEMALAEKVTIACTQDQNSSSGLAGNENFLGSGQVGYNSLSWQYPGGSGASIGTSAINGSKNNSFGTLLNNGDFELVSGTSLVSWTTIAGTVAVGHIPYTGANNLILGSTGSPVAVAQTFGVDNSAVLSYGTQYAVNCWIQVTAPATGNFTLSLVDGSNTVINDQQGTPNVITKDLSTVSGTYIPVNGCFRLPQILPATIKLRVGSSGVITGGNVLVDRVAFGPVTTLYAGGPSFAIFSGSINFYAGVSNSIPGDYFTMTIANPRPTNQKTFLWLLDRIYKLKRNNLMFPTSASPTINDALITT